MLYHMCQRMGDVFTLIKFYVRPFTFAQPRRLTTEPLVLEDCKVFNSVVFPPTFSRGWSNQIIVR